MWAAALWCCWLVSVDATAPPLPTDDAVAYDKALEETAAREAHSRREPDATKARAARFAKPPRTECFAGEHLARVFADGSGASLGDFTAFMSFRATGCSSDDRKLLTGYNKSAGAPWYVTTERHSSSPNVQFSPNISRSGDLTTSPFAELGETPFGPTLPSSDRGRRPRSDAGRREPKRT